MPPTWPDNGIPQQIHFDLYVVGIEALDAAHETVVHASPAGHPFCICWLLADIRLTGNSATRPGYHKARVKSAADHAGHQHRSPSDVDPHMRRAISRF